MLINMLNLHFCLHNIYRENWNTIWFTEILSILIISTIYDMIAVIRQTNHSLTIYIEYYFNVSVFIKAHWWSWSCIILLVPMDTYNYHIISSHTGYNGHWLNSFFYLCGCWFLSCTVIIITYSPYKTEVVPYMVACNSTSTVNLNIPSPAARTKVCLVLIT